MSNREIDREKWDECVRSDGSHLLYGNSWYLDLVCPDWNALIEGDYHSVFPLPVKRKFGIWYVYHPLFAQQLGLFVKQDKGFTTSDFIKAIPSKYIKVNLQLKADGSEFKGSHFSERLNHILPIATHDLIEKGFNQNTKRNIKRSKAEDIQIGNELSASEFVEFKKHTSKATLSEEEWMRMKDLIQLLMDKKLGSFITAYAQDELISAIFYTEWNGKITYLFSSSSAKGKELRSSFLLVDRIVRDHAGQSNVLDFEGSMDANIARFFKGFGAMEEVYYEYRKGISY